MLKRWVIFLSAWFLLYITGKHLVIAQLQWVIPSGETNEQRKCRTRSLTAHDAWQWASGTFITPNAHASESNHWFYLVPNVNENKIIILFFLHYSSTETISRSGSLCSAVLNTTKGKHKTGIQTICSSTFNLFCSNLLTCRKITQLFVWIYGHMGSQTCKGLWYSFCWQNIPVHITWWNLILLCHRKITCAGRVRSWDLLHTNADSASCQAFTFF